MFLIASFVLLFVLLIFIKIFVTTTNGLIKVVAVYSIILAVLFTMSYESFEKTVSLEKDLKTSSIPTPDSLTNGLYRIISSYEGPGKMILVILHQERMTGIDPVRRVFSTTPINPIPVLVSLDRPVTRQNDTNATYTGFVEVITDSFGNKSLQRYFPFKHME